jgi:hypothetical protein
MKVTYRVYNTITNTHDTVDTIEAAESLKQRLVNEGLKEKFEELNNLIGVNAVNVHENGDEVWAHVEANSTFVLEDQND